MPYYGKAISRQGRQPVALTILALLNVVPYAIAAIGASFGVAINLEAAMGLYSGTSDLLCHPWGVVTYMFTHTEPLHLFFNMAVLYIFGRAIAATGRRESVTLWLYMAGGLAGAVFYLLFYGALLGRDSILTGASAAVLAVAVGAAILIPNMKANLWGSGAISLRALAGIVVAISVLGLAGANIGGALAHLGGITAGIAVATALSAAERRKAERRRKIADELEAFSRRTSVSGFDTLSPDEQKRLFDLSSKQTKNNG